MTLLPLTIGRAHFFLRKPSRTIWWWTIPRYYGDIFFEGPFMSMSMRLCIVIQWLKTMYRCRFNVSVEKKNLYTFMYWALSVESLQPIIESNFFADWLSVKLIFVASCASIASGAFSRRSSSGRSIDGSKIDLKKKNGNCENVEFDNKRKLFSAACRVPLKEMEMICDLSN